MANDITYDRILLSIATGQICQSLGWHGIHKTPHNILTDVLERYINDLSRTVIGCSLNGSRTCPNIEDVNLAFDQLGVELHELEDYISQVEPSPLHRAVSKIPASIEASTSLLKFPTPEEVGERAEYIDEHLPPLVKVMVDKEEEQEETKETEEVMPVTEDNVKQETTEEINAAPRRPKDLVLFARTDSTESPPYSPIEPKSLNLDAQENVDLTRPGLKVTTPRGFTPTLTTQPPLMGIASITHPLANITNKKNTTSVISPAQLIASVPKTDESLTVIKKPTPLTTKTPTVQRNSNLITPSSVVRAVSPLKKTNTSQKLPSIEKSVNLSSSLTSAKKEPDKATEKKLTPPKSPSVKKIIKTESLKVELESPNKQSPKPIATTPEKVSEKTANKEIEKDKVKEPPPPKSPKPTEKLPAKPKETKSPPKPSKNEKAEEKSKSTTASEKSSKLTIIPTIEVKKEPVELKPVSVVVSKMPDTVITSPVKPLKIELPSPPVTSKKPALTLSSLLKNPITPTTPKQPPSTPKLNSSSKSIPTTPVTPKTPSYLKGGPKPLAGLRKIASEPIVSPFDDDDDIPYGLRDNKRGMDSPPPLTRSPMFTSPPAIPVERQAPVKIETEPDRSPSRSPTPPSPLPSPKPSLADSEVRSDVDIEEMSDHDNTIESNMHMQKVSFAFPPQEDTHKKKKKKKDKNRDKSSKSDGSSKDKRDKKKRNKEEPVPIPKITLKMGGETISDSSAKFVFKSVPSPSPSPSPVSPVTPSLPSPVPPPPPSSSKASAKKAKQSKSKETKDSKQAAKAAKEEKSSGFYVETLENTSSALGGEVYYCPACGLPDDGSPMIGCDACDLWYHWPCVNITVEPEEDEKWYCPKCHDGQPKRKKKKKKH